MKKSDFSWNKEIPFLEEIGFLMERLTSKEILFLEEIGFLMEQRNPIS
ncbi:hypothetical protein BGP_5074 [Beggiatoa sp. PS]|nr:hypothetical protein BGP_5074 [Beggiatoa sp. PS]